LFSDDMAVFALGLLALGLALCPSLRFAFYHVPKGGGNSIYSLLTKHAPNQCFVYGGILDKTEAVEWLGAGDLVAARLQVDPMHVTPLQLDEWIHRSELRLQHRSKVSISDAQRFGVGDVDTGVSHQTMSVADVQLSWRSATVVRSPYLRVLSAYDQRTNFTIYTKIWGPAPSPFDAYMRWLDEGLRSRSLAWCCDPTITHFLPSTRFTHWPDGSKAITDVFKTEEMAKAQRGILEILGVNGTAGALGPSEHANGHRAGSSKRAALCQHPYGCDASELGLLLNTTAHTVETLRIVERLYRRDFEWLGYRRFDL